MAKEQDRITRLQRRLDHLNERIVAPGRSENALGWDKSEASALRWAIALCELALSNWPAGIQAVRELEDRDEL